MFRRDIIALNSTKIFEEKQPYCGESFCEIDAERQSAALDIHPFEFSRGRGIVAFIHKIRFSGILINPELGRIEWIICLWRK